MRSARATCSWWPGARRPARSSWRAARCCRTWRWRSWIRGRMTRRWAPGGGRSGLGAGRTGLGRRIGLALVAIALAAAVLAPVLAPHGIDDKFVGLLNAPPTIPHLIDNGSVRAPFIYPWRLVNQLEQIYEQDRSAPVPLQWFAGGHVV